MISERKQKLQKAELQREQLKTQSENLEAKKQRFLKQASVTFEEKIKS